MFAIYFVLRILRIQKLPFTDRIIVSKVEDGFVKKIKTGVFGADIKVALINDGPVTIQIDSKSKN